MNTLGLDTIAGAKLLQLKFGAAADFQPDQAVMHGDRRARFIRVKNGTAIIQHWGDSHAVAVPLEALSIPAEKPRYPAMRAPRRSRRVIRAEMGWLPRDHRQRRPVLRS